MLERRPAQTNKSKGPGRGRSKPLWHGDQTKMMTAGFWRVLMEIPSILPRPMARRRQYPSSWRADEHSDGGSGELRGDDLAKFHGLIRLPDEGETITSTRPGEVAFYEAAFPAGLRFPLHNTIRLILQFYNICPAQLVPNAWRSIACSMALWRVYKYSISLSEFRNLFSLNCNPKPDQGWLYFKARNKKVLLGGYPATLRGGRASSFFVSGDEWEIPEECLERIRPAIILLGFMATKRQSLKRFSGQSRSRDASPYLCYWNPNHFAGSLSLPVLGHRGWRATICRAEKCRAPRAITELRRLLPHIPDLTLLRWTGGKVLDPILDHYLNVPSSNPSSESCSDSSLPIELESDAMSKRVSFKKIGEKLGKAASSSSGAPVPAKGVIIGEKRPGESITSSPSKKEKVDDGSKGKGVVIGPEGKKKATSSSPTASMLGSPSVAEKFLRGVISPADKEKVEKLTLDQTATKFFHVIGQALVLGSSLAVRSREVGEQASSKRGEPLQWKLKLLASRRLLPIWSNNWPSPVLVSSRPMTNLPRRIAIKICYPDKFERSGILVNELREALNKSKEFAMEEFKSSSEFMVAVEDSASKYFGEGFNFCKVQLRRHLPTSPLILKELWSIKICWRSKTRPKRRKTRRRRRE
ncbi:hypothetical protein Acr_25g0004500 [Actinidia rufa]|uniref:Transposase (putative) gypsy type domain-containing protein n=1 Tax=Actinidia rufa TaxID=165716 RepID=A0A7J0GZ40_9ERIC|nr:hypothetical protein Acr_25g0004500 [Actinidia rufa]